MYHVSYLREGGNAGMDIPKAEYGRINKRVQSKLEFRKEVLYPLLIFDSESLLRSAKKTAQRRTADAYDRESV